MRNSISRLCMAGARNLFWLMIFIIPIGGGYFIANQYDPAFVNSITEGISHHSIIFRMIRWVVILLTMCFWPYFVLLIGRRYNVTLEKAVYWQRERFRVAMWLIIFELLICENIIGKLIHLLIGA